MRWTAVISLLLTLIPVAAIAAPRPILKLGAEGPDVTEVQALLTLLGYYDGVIDGRFTETTLIGITRFQEAAGISQDGVLGTQTWAKLLPPANGTTPEPQQSPSQPAPKPTTNPTAQQQSTPKNADPQALQYPILRKGAKGDAVARVQSRLRSLGFLNAPVDGDFGIVTEQALKAAQKEYKLDPDGVVGEATWRALKL
jgi:N-acetylmuramoyl-L-alanine amidase